MEERLVKISFFLFSYNQERFILQALESILNQSIKYNRGKEIELIISDDNSEDQTFYIENVWAQKNEDFFSRIVVLPSDCHRGINQNVLRAMRYAEGTFFRFIAGDDLLADLDIISYLGDDDIYIFSRFMFQNSSLYPALNGNNKKYYLFWKESVNEIREHSKVYFPFTLASIVFRKTLLSSQVISMISKFEYLEDRPMWDGFMLTPDLHIAYVNSPIYLQRVTTTSISNPISRNKMNGYYKKDIYLFLKDKRKSVIGFLDKYIVTIYMYQTKYSWLRFLNPYNIFLLYRRLIREKEMVKNAMDLDRAYLFSNQKFLEEMQVREKTFFEEFLKLHMYCKNW